MANEAVILESPLCYRSYTCANGTSISKGTLLILTDPNTAAASTGINAAFAGVAAMDKAANDGSTTISAVTWGIYDITAIANVGFAAGDLVVLSGANLVRRAIASDLLSGCIVGKALEDASASEVVRVAVGDLT